MKRIVFIVLFVFTVLAAGHAFGSEEDSLARVQRSGTLVVGFCAAYPPFESRNDISGELEGFDIDLAKALAAELGLKLELHDAEWQGLIPSLNKGDFDVLITGMNVTEERAKNVDFTEPYYQLQDVVVVRQDNIDISSTDDLRGKLVGVQIGTASELRAARAETEHGFAELRRYNYNPEAFLDLEHGRIDAVVVGKPYAVTALKEPRGLKIAAPLDSDVSHIAIVVRKNSPSLTEALNKGLASLKENGKLNSIEAKWFSVVPEAKP